MTYRFPKDSVLHQQHLQSSSWSIRPQKSIPLPLFKIYLSLVFSSTAPRCKCRAPLAPSAGQQEVVRARLPCQPAWQDRLPSLLLACCCSDSTACRRSELGILGNDRKQGLPALTHCPIWVFERFEQSQKISV